MRLGIACTENFVFVWLYAHLSLSLDKIGCGSAKPVLKTSFSFGFALAFHYLCNQIKVKEDIEIDIRN